MKKIKWDESVKTGISDVDIQHRILFNISKILVDSLENNHENDIIDSILEEIIRYAKYHTEFETKYHVESIENKEEHRKAHEEFINNVENLKKIKNNTNNREFAIFMNDFICDWIENHIKGMDMRDVKMV